MLVEVLLTLYTFVARLWSSLNRFAIEGLTCYRSLQFVPILLLVSPRPKTSYLLRNRIVFYLHLQAQREPGSEYPFLSFVYVPRSPPPLDTEIAVQLNKIFESITSPSFITIRAFTSLGCCIHL